MIQNKLYDVTWKLAGTDGTVEGTEVVSAPDEKQALTAIKKRLKNRKELKGFDISKGEFSFASTGVIPTPYFR